MKRFIYASIMSIAMLFLSGCGGGGDAVITSLNINNLEDGYDVAVKDSSGDEYIANFCQDKLRYYRMDGTFVVERFYWITGSYLDISELDDGTRDWYWDVTAPHAEILEVGVLYDEYDSDNDFILDREILSIEKVPCP